MTLVERLVEFLNLGLRHDRGQAGAPHPADNLLHHAGGLGALDDQGQLHGRRSQAHGGLGVGVLGAVDDVGPLDELGQVGRLVAELLPGHRGNELGAGAAVRIVHLPGAGLAPEMLLVFRPKKGALVVVEPPCQPRVRRVLEIHNGVLVAVEHALFKELRGLVGQAGENELGVGMVGILQKPAEKRRGGCAVEAIVVVENSDSHDTFCYKWKTIQIASIRGKLQAAPTV